MKILMIKYYPIAISETFIIDQANNLNLNNVLIHRPFPVLFRTVNSSASLFLNTCLDVCVKFAAKFTDKLYNYLVYNILKKNRPNLVFIHYGNTAIKMYEACIKLNIPYIVHFHGSDAHQRSLIARHKDRYRAMLRNAKGIVVVSKPMQSAVIGLGATPNSIFLNPYGIDALKFSLKQDSKYLLAVGRFVEKKAPHLSIEAFAKLVKKHPNNTMIMIGSGPLLNKCKDLADSLGVKDSVKFLGAQNHEIVKQYMTNASVFVQHSVVAPDGDSEGSPVAITEAAACGIPVVSTKHAAIPEIVKNGITGLLVEEGDVEGMSDAMITLIENPDLQKNMSEASREHILANYTQSKRIGRLRDIILWACDNSYRKPELEGES